MSSVQTIEVHTAPAYEVTIGAGLLRDCGARLKAVLGGCRIAVIADSNVAPLYLETVCASLRDAGFAVCSGLVCVKHYGRKTAFGRRYQSGIMPKSANPPTLYGRIGLG